LPLLLDLNQRHLRAKVTARSAVTGNVFACKNLPRGETT